jgi:hypothetical protein
MFVRDRLVIPDVNKKMMSFKGKDSWTKMTLPGGKLIALACHPTKTAHKAEELTCLSTNIEFVIFKVPCSFGKNDESEILHHLLQPKGNQIRVSPISH